MNQFRMISLALAGALLAGIVIAAAVPSGRGFASPDAAAKALVEAAKSDDVSDLIAILGPSAKEILTTQDSVADRKARQTFAARASEKIKLVPDPRVRNAKTLLAGRDEWPLPIPIVQMNGQWYFDTAQGKKEILMRRIGGNELDAIEVCRGYVEAQNAYAEEDRTGSGRPHFAQKIISSPGQRDGLYWPSTDGNDESPIGDVISRAFAEGYTAKRSPYHGYYFKVLTKQGAHASGGEMSYLDNGVMTKGFALVAWPSDYGSTGVMTFVVDKAGIVYQKDLGPKTREVMSAYTAYDPDKTWTPVSVSLSQLRK